MVQPINTGFLTDTTASRFAGQQLSEGLSALGKGIAGGMQRQQQREDKKAEQEKLNALKERELARKELSTTMDIVEKLSGGDVRVMRDMYGKIDKRFAKGGELDFSNVPENILSQRLANLKNAINENNLEKVQESISTIGAEGTEDEIKRSKLMTTPFFKKQEGLEKGFKTVGQRLKDEGLADTPENRKFIRDKIAKEQSERQAQAAATIKKEEQRAKLVENVVALSNETPIVGATTGDVIDNPDLIKLNNNDMNQYTTIKQGLQDKIRLIDVMREGLKSKDGANKFFSVMRDSFTNWGFLKQLKDSDVATMNDYIKGSLSTMMQEMGMGKVASDRDMASVEAKFVNIADPEAANEFKIAIFENALDNLSKNFLRSRSRKHSVEQLKDIYMDQNNVMKEVGELMTDSDTLKGINGTAKSFPQFFKEARSGSITGRPMRLKSILNAWKNPSGLATQDTGKLQADAVQQGGIKIMGFRRKQ